ncbi:MAG: cupin domain-containing protein [Gammaproteobacteria bacterium]
MSILKAQHLLLTVTLGAVLSYSTTDSSVSESPNNNTDAQLPDPLAAGWQGQPVCAQLPSGPQQRVLKCTFPPGVGHERHFHAPHFGYALSGGTMQLTDANGTRQVDLATDSHFTSSGTPWHEVLNVGETTVEYLIVETLSN